MPVRSKLSWRIICLVNNRFEKIPSHLGHLASPGFNLIAAGRGGLGLGWVWRWVVRCDWGWVVRVDCCVVVGCCGVGFAFLVRVAVVVVVVVVRRVVAVVGVGVLL